MSMYVPLWCKSHFSFLKGASHPEELIETARRLGLSALALTDHDGLYGIVRGQAAARENGIKLICGAQVTLSDGSSIVLLVQNKKGYRNLCRLLTAGQGRTAKGSSYVIWKEVCEYAEGLIALWGGSNSLLAGRADPGIVGRTLAEAFGERLYGLVVRHLSASDQVREYRTKERIKKYGISVAAAVEVQYHTRARRPLQDMMTCIREKSTITTIGRRINQNAEHELLPNETFKQRFLDLPDAVENTEKIADICVFNLNQVQYRYPTESLPDGTPEAEWLRHLVMNGALWRYSGAIPVGAKEQIEKELLLVEELDYGGYFLTMWEIVQYCKTQNILCQGRGSAANSIICYCLGITAIDPIQMGLLFERFLSRERAEPPDIDLDIEHNRREEVIQHVYKEYGRKHAAMVANFVRYRPRSAVRDVGKALGIPATTIDRVAKLLPHNGEITMRTLQSGGLDPLSNTTRLLLQFVNEIQDFPRHISIHPGGFLLGHDPVCEIVPIENATMENRTVIQWDKEDIEELNLFKVDLLGLGALTVVDDCFRLILEHYGIELSLDTIPQDDGATYDMLCRGDTIGCFQVESRAQMAMLPRLRPRNFYDLVIEISLVRPGPITGGMVHPYLRRRQGKEPIDYPHPCLVPVLQKTLGIPLFQEQVMRLAVVAADYTPGEADQLRRDMAAWRRTGRIERHRERLITRMIKKGIAPVFAERVFEQIRGFGDYGFPESHAASFALICYATAYLKCHYPAEFACALLNAQPMGFYAPATIVHDAKRHGVKVLPIDVSKSSWNCRIELQKEAHTLRMGFRYVKGLGKKPRHGIGVGGRESAAQKSGRGRFPNTLHEYIRNSQLRVDQLVALAETGAFKSFGLSRREALWVVREAARGDSLRMQTRRAVPKFRELTHSENIIWDFIGSSHSTIGHPIETVRPMLSEQGFPDAKTVRSYKNKILVRYVGLVICRQRPATARGVVFMTLEDETGFVNIVIWSSLFERFSEVAKVSPLLGVTGHIQSHDGVVHVVAAQLWKPELDFRRDIPRSRDFR